MIAPPRVRVQRLRLENIRCFDELEVEFGRGGKATDWTLLLGGNGAGKSTLLRALALGLAPAQDIGAMLHADGHSWVGSTSNMGRIEVDLEVDDKLLKRRVEVEGSRRSMGFTASGEANDWLTREPLLLAGYGAARQLQGSREFSGYSPHDSTATLMSPNGSLQNPELALRRAVDGEDEVAIELLASIERILLLEPGSTELGKTGLMVKQPDGSTRPLTQLSDGYRGTLGWVLDLIGWDTMAVELFEREVPAIVLVDEVEQHLHPQWQRSVIARLREQFPDAQFIVSTHSPLCVLGSIELPDEDISLTYIERGLDAEGKPYSRATSGVHPPRGQRADQVLNSYIFGLTSSRDAQTERDITELAKLLGEAVPSAEQHERIEALQSQLEPLLGSAETALEREVQRASLAAAERVIEQRVAQLSKDEATRLLALEELAP